MISTDYSKSEEIGRIMMSDLPERYKTCGRCIHDESDSNIVGTTCYLCKRNPDDHRIDWFEERKENKND